MKPLSPAAMGAVVLGSVLVLLGIAGVARELPDLWDPCLTWGVGDQGSSHMSPDDPCQAKSGTSETKGDFLVRLALVPGFVAACGAAAIVGGMRGQRGWLLGSSLGLAGETVVLFMGLSAAFALALAAAVAMGVFTARLPHRPPSGPVPPPLETGR